MQTQPLLTPGHFCRLCPGEGFLLFAVHFPPYVSLWLLADYVEGDDSVVRVTVPISNLPVLRYDVFRICGSDINYRTLLASRAGWSFFVI